jgi:hypothetical protein
MVMEDMNTETSMALVQNDPDSIKNKGCKFMIVLERSLNNIYKHIYSSIYLPGYLPTYHLLQSAYPLNLS